MIFSKSRFCPEIWIFADFLAIYLLATGKKKSAKIVFLHNSITICYVPDWCVRWCRVAHKLLGVVVVDKEETQVSWLGVSG